MIPVAVIVGYIGTKVTLRPFRKWQQGLLFAVMLCIIAFCGKTIFSRPMGLIENIYKIPDEVIEICEIIRADSPKDEPCVAADFDLDVLINQYAPEIDLILSYRELAEIKELESFGEYRDAPSNRLKYVLIDGTVHDEGYLIYALTEGQVDYIVTQRGAPAREYILASQCRLIAELEQYCIFRVEIEES